MKKNYIPEIPALSALDMANAELLLEQFGKHDIIEMNNWKEQYPYKPISNFTMAYNKEGVFIKYDVRGSMLKAIYSNDHDPVYKDSCVEFFCKLPNADTYANFEFNCIGTCQASKRKSRSEGVVPFPDAAMKSIIRLPSIGRRPFMEMKGNFEWSLTVFIPFDLIGIVGEAKSQILMANFYKCADDTESMHYLSWSPIKTENPDFHRPEFFGEIVFG